MEKIIGFSGLFFFIGLSWLLSQKKRQIQWKPVIVGVALQFVFAFLILKTPFGRPFFDGAKEIFESILSFSAKGASFVFGPLADLSHTGRVFGPEHGFIFFFQITATIIFMSSLMSVLYHLKIMQKIVFGFAWVMQKSMGISGAESVATASNIFLGQTEAALTVRPYLKRMTQSEILSLMAGGMSNVAGGVLAAFVGFGIDAGHLLAASVMSAPATFAICKVMLPETESPETAGTTKLHDERSAVNVIDAACQGASEGLQLALNVMGMLIAFIALVALGNHILMISTGTFMATPLTLETLLGWIFSPIAFFMGVPWKDVTSVGALIGVKTSLNEFVAFMNLSKVKESLDPRSVVIATYALCGFANFSSIAIQIGGIGALEPTRRTDLAKLGLRAMIAGSFASFMAACIAGLLL